MTDIIKKAVELADSWEMVGDVICFSVAAGDRKRSACSIHNTHTVYLDALAAQLYRQYVVKVGHGFYRSPDPLVDITEIVETGALE